jgi:peptide/nickel transport system ATP-binding protein
MIAGMADAATAGASAETSVASLRDLRVSLRRHGARTDVIRGVDLDIRRGEILGLVGESGSGKSVLSLAMLGLLPASADPQVTGHISVNGVDMAGGSDSEKRRARRVDLGAVFQDPMTSLNPTMRIGEQVEEAAGSAVEAVRLMGAVGIPQPERRFPAYPHELSGGLRQRVMIAMAIAGGPKLVIADEPTTALDVTVQAQVLTVLRSLRDDVGCSILMITHDLGVAGQLADRIAVMYAGRLAEVGSAEDVLNRSRHPYTTGLLGSRLDLSTDRRSRLRTLPQESAPKEERDRGCAYHTRCPMASERCGEDVPPLVVAGADTERPVDGVAASVPHASACFFADEASIRLTTFEEQPAAGLAHDVEPAASGRGAALALTELRCEFPVRDERGRKATLSALRGVTLDIRAGESIALVGESGSGKSTLLRVVAGLQRSHTGAVEGPARDRVQMVFQDAGASLTPWLRVEELLSERLAGRGRGRAARRRRVVEILDSVGLPESTMKAKPSELSGGQRQRVALARATIVAPEILLCDEPTSALDVSLAANVLNLIQKLRHELGMTVIFVTHDLSVARIIGDRIAVMYLGRLVEVGPADEVIADPKHPYTRALISAVPGSNSRLPEILGEPASPLAPPSGCAYHPRCPVARDDCSSTLSGIQLVPISPRPASSGSGGERSVACVHRGVA